MHKWTLVIVLLLLSLGGAAISAQPSESHPRLWITPTSLEQYRAWAADDNPFYSDSLLPLAEQAKADMDAGNIQNGDFGSNAYEDYVTENYAALFAFMSLIHPDSAHRDEYAQRARTLLMVVINEAAKGAAAGEPFRDPAFSINDRSRWHGVSFPLTVDWIYPMLSADDKALIRTVFLRWMAELTVADTTNYNHPEPVGIVNDPILVSDLDAVRWSGNNYYTAHLRNMGMMALAFDPADDPNGELRSYLDQATGAWLYVNDYLMRTEAAGGFGTEGFEYSPQSVGYVAQFLLALHTAGITDTARYGQQILFEANPFWDASVPAYFHSLSPQTRDHPDYGGQMYDPAWYGSGQDYFNPDHIQWFAPMGIYDALTGNETRLNAIRWLQTHTPLGGAEALIDRSNDASEFYKNILYFLLFDPSAAEPVDPRPSYPTTLYASGMRRLLARTDWTPDASWFTYALSWNRVDHQTGNGNAIEFYRKGEWLTKIRVGYDLDYITSDNLNTLTVENDPIDRDDFRLMISQRGSQWLYSANNPPQPIYSDTPTYLYVMGDSTNLYNTDYEGLNGVTHVSRSVLWLKPNDTLVVYDRATTAAEDRTKRFILNLTDNASINGNQITMLTSGGQQFQITSLLPANAALSVNEIPDEISSAPAHYEIIRYRYESRVETGADVRFLHVLQGLDGGVTPASAVQATCADYDVAIVSETAVLFNRDAGQPFSDFSCALPSVVTRVYLLEVTPSTGYEIIVDGVSLSVTTGSTYTSDAAGVVSLS